MLQDDFILGNGKARCFDGPAGAAETEEEKGGQPVIRHLLQVSGRLQRRTSTV